MRWWHLPQVVTLEQQVFGDECWSARTFWSELGQIDTRHLVVALEGDQVVGYGGFCDYPDEGWIQTMAVAPDRQGKGLGSTILAALLAEADRRAQRVVALEVAADNVAGQALYARFGFQRTAVRRGYYQPSGTDAYVLSRRS